MEKPPEKIIHNPRVYAEEGYLKAFFWTEFQNEELNIGLKRHPYYIKISTIISYCSLDNRFIKLCVNNALAVSEEVIVTYCSHLFDGTPEDTTMIEELKREFPTVKYVPFEWHEGKRARYWHTTSRIKGQEAVDENIDWIHFVDADEIIDPELFSAFLNEPQTYDYAMYRFASHWYFREPTYQAKPSKSFRGGDMLFHEQASVLIRKEFSCMEPELDTEREQLNHCAYCSSSMYKFKELYNVKWFGVPMLHHFSWCRTKEEMLRKAELFGHGDGAVWSQTTQLKDGAPKKDWKTLIEEEFSGDFSGTDFIHGYDYDIVEDKFGIGRINE